MQQKGVSEAACGQPRTPAVAVDVVIEIGAGQACGIVLIERRHPPAGWALPGGFVDPGETLARAAVREVREETGLSVRLRCLLGCYSDPGRDPRGPVISVVYAGTAAGVPIGRDDARAARIVDPAAPGVPLAFDHARIIRDYRMWRATGRSPGWDAGEEG